MLKKIYTVFYRIRAAAIILGLGWMVVFCLLQVILRYFTNGTIKSFAWGDEMIRMVFVCVSFLAVSVGVRAGAHLGLDLFVDKLLPPKGRVIIRKTGIILALISMVLFMWFGTKQTIRNIPNHLQNLTSFSMAWFYASIPIGSFYVFIEYRLILVYGTHPFSSSDVDGIEVSSIEEGEV
jgi:TRAP-type C4-dicarboxylate transport system permease small subunit